ncbi:RNA polymerase sigma factor [Nocardioides montaniterrae]
MPVDDATISAAKAGDPDAWRVLYRAHAGRLLVWLESRMASSSDTAEDIAAAAWLTAAEKIADFTGDSGDFAGWLFGIARNYGLNSRRRAARRAAVDATQRFEEPRTPSPETSLAASDWVRRVLSGLPDRERDVLTCMEVLDLDVAATCEALGMSAVAVRVARHRGLKRLRGSFAQPASTRASSTSR